MMPRSTCAAAPPFTSLKITGVDVFSAGALAAVDNCDEEIMLHDAKGVNLQEGDELGQVDG